jgi:hypothetical protein
MKVYLIMNMIPWEGEYFCDRAFDSFDKAETAIINLLEGEFAGSDLYVLEQEVE